MSEKFCLKWNDFNSNASKSFRVFRKEEYLHDVTLVSDDQHQTTAHKLVLSACSDFFKNVIKKVSHSNPMIYLSGFKSCDLIMIMDYIYQGQVQILQSDLDRFLNVAKKLKIDGLIGKNEEHEDHVYLNDDDQKYHMESSKEYSTGDEVDETVKQESITVKKRLPHTAAVDDLVEQTENGWSCKACGWTSKTTQTSPIRKHAELHIEGLSFDCQLCDKSFRSRNALHTHKSRRH